MLIDRHRIRRNLIVLLSLGLLACLFFACATIPTYHQTYDYLRVSCPVNVLPSPGRQFTTLEKQDTRVLAVKWQPHQGPDTSATTPSQVTLQVELIGPFPSLASFYTMIQPDGSTQYFPTTPVVAVAPAIKTTNWTKQIYTSNLQFPHSLVPGYYQVIETIDVSENADGTHATHASGQCIIRV